MESTELHFEQYKLLRGEIMRHTAEVQKLEVYAIASVAALFSWLSANTHVSNQAWFIALIIPVFFGGRSYVLLQRIRHIAEYLREIEKVIFEDEKVIKGWETTFKKSTLKVLFQEHQRYSGFYCLLSLC